MTQKKEKLLFNRELSNESIIRGVLYFILTIYPFILLPKETPYFILDKTMLLFITSMLLIILIAVDRKIKIYKIHIISLIFIGSLFIASIFSKYRDIAFWGSLNSREGFYVICTYIILFFVASNYFRISKKVFDLIMLAPTVMCIYGVFQFFGYDPIQKIVLGKIVTNETIGLIGHRNFFSTYIILFLSTYLAYYIFNGGKRYLICTSIMFSSLLCTTTRSGWVSFSIMAFIGLLFIIKRKESLKRAILIFIIFISIFGFLNHVSNGAIFRRAEIIVNEASEVTSALIDKEVEIKESFGSSRIFIWKMASKAFIDRPILGEGPDTLRNRLIEDYNEKYMSYAKNGDYFEKSHNEVLEYAVSGGIVTAISFIIILIMIFIGLLKRINNDNIKIIFLVFIAYVIQSMFNISVISVAPLVWIMFGIAVKAYSEGVNSIIKE